MEHFCGQGAIFLRTGLLMIRKNLTLMKAMGISIFFLWWLKY